MVNVVLVVFIRCCRVTQMRKKKEGSTTFSTLSYNTEYQTSRRWHGDV